MPNHALPAFHFNEITEFTVQADHELTEALRAYQSYYEKLHGAKVTEADLLREMARQFMAHDKPFNVFRRKAKRAKRTGSAAASRDQNPAKPPRSEASMFDDKTR